MRILVVVVLALVALGAGGVWALGQFGDNFTSVASEPREPVLLEPQITLAANEPAVAPAAAVATPTPSPTKPAAMPASRPAAPKSEPAESQPAPAQPAAPAPAAAETQATPAPPPPVPEAAPASPVAPAKPNPFKPNSLNSDKPAEALSQLLPGAKKAAPSAPAAEAPAASAPAASPPAPAESAAPAATAQSAPAQSAQARSAPAQPADPIVKPQQVQGPVAANTATAAATGLQAQLKSRAITYNRPPAKLALNKVVDVTLVINATEDADAGKEALQGSKGEIVERNVDLSDVVTAQLTALNGGFRITPLTVERQKLSGKILNRWQWSVEPIEVGTHTLVLDIFGYESGSPDAEQLAAYQDRITVEVQQLDQVIGWAKGVQPLFAVLAALAGITSAAVAFIRFRDERKAKKSAKSS